MKLATFRPSHREWRLGCVVDGDIVDMSAAASGTSTPEVAGRLSTMGSLLAGGDGAIELCERVLAVAGGAPRYGLDQVELAPPVPSPGQVVAVGRNYAEHAQEAGIDTAALPRLFPKWPSTLIGSGAPIIKPSRSREVDWEVELGVVIGKPARNVPAEQALEHVFGYTLVNDVSARDIQFSQPEQLTLGKNFRTFAPMGAWIVTRDEVGDPGALQLRCWVNDELMQDGNTRDMIADVQSLISFISEVVDLEPGDVISTGTPSGVGCFRDPPVYLEDGDRIRMELLRGAESLCTLENQVTDLSVRPQAHEQEVNV